MYLFKTKEGFVGIDSVRRELRPLISYCLYRTDYDFEDSLQKLLRTKKIDPENFFIFGVFYNFLTDSYQIESYLEEHKVDYQFILYTDSSSFYNDYDLYDSFDDCKEDFERIALEEVKYEFLNYYLNLPELYYVLYDNNFNFIKEKRNFSGRTIEDSEILNDIGEIKYFLGVEYDCNLSNFQKEYFCDESRFFKKDLEKLIKFNDFGDIVELSDNSFLEFVEKDSFIEDFEIVIKKLSNSCLKNNLLQIFEENNPKRFWNLEKFMKSEILDIFFR